ncbi:putative addiction module antidote protein [Chlorobium sp. BLA1]|uniref:addiction module antidote protein n=1 Tax=Candidatus Chlorobium masyuteum TaxID=2716876 RepID=UPI00141F3871|nr:addiction module antidote protein [Candidatus Chlorobium masyuteum]NHQ61238.1 putative addiction module antidote protein [Candidatus Chlorobium masyuteum]NTU45833.1 putative addiction module antidote protein [Chlorobiaceae bacterium]
MNTVTIRNFDPVNYLDNDEMIVEYLKATAEDPNPEVFLAALGDVARAKGMTEIAKKTGLGRESLYKALRPGAHPRYETVKAVLKAVGVEMTFKEVS